MSADGLLVATGGADVGGSIFVPADGVYGENTLPGGGGHEALAENGLGRETRAGPVAPGGKFGGVKTRGILEAVGEEMAGSGGGQLGADLSRGTDAIVL